MRSPLNQIPFLFLDRGDNDLMREEPQETLFYSLPTWLALAEPWHCNLVPKKIFLEWFTLRHLFTTAMLRTTTPTPTWRNYSKTMLKFTRFMYKHLLTCKAGVKINAYIT